ncbi:hypothetical protein BJ912DRAFT_591583 [Pholiota molesta]|nr:hypothetical protein BJ912DRAFT_591583 [Pholiota molesta]
MEGDTWRRRRMMMMMMMMMGTGMTTAASESYTMTGAERWRDEAGRDNETRRRKIGQTGAHPPKADDAHAFDQSIHPSIRSIHHWGKKEGKCQCPCANKSDYKQDQKKTKGRWSNRKERWSRRRRRKTGGGE